MAESVPRRVRRTAESAAAGPALVGSVRNIPDDILLFHILILLPAKCLGRFASVCKLWRATIRSAPFVRRHMEASRAARPSSMALVPLKSPKDPTKTGAAGVNIFRFEPGEGRQSKQVAELMLEKEVAGGVPVFSVPLHCNGLVLIPCTTGQVFVCNPTTGEFVELPPLTHVPSLDHRAALAFDPWSGTYKVGRPFIRSYRETEVDGQSTIAEYSVGHEIFTIGDPNGGSWSWKETVDPPYPIKPRTPICLPGVFYCSGVKSKGLPDTDVILRFSLQDERFTVHPNPPCSGILSIYDWLCDLGGCLCYLHSSQFHVDIWLAKDGLPDLTWSLWCSINLHVPRCLHVLACVSADREKIFLSIDACYLLIGDLRGENGELVKMIDMDCEVVYDDRNGSRFTTVGLPISHFMVPFVESLVRIRP